MKYILFLMMILFSNQAVALNCAQAPSCEELGYSTDDNQNCLADGYLICPFDSNYKKCVNFNCESLGFTQSNKSGWCGKLAFCPNDKTYTACKALCEIGDVYYSDGTCGYAQDYDASSGKTPAGIVFYTTDGGYHGKVLSLTHVPPKQKFFGFPPNKESSGASTSMMPMGTCVPKDITVFENSIILNELKNGNLELYDGKGNTQAMLERPNFCQCNDIPQTDPNYPYYCQATGAIAVNAYSPTESLKNSPIVGQGKWYIPAIGELLYLSPVEINEIKTFINDASGAKNTTQAIIDKTVEILTSKGITAEKLSDQPCFFTSSYMTTFINYFICAKGSRTYDACYDSHIIRAILAF